MGLSSLRSPGVVESRQPRALHFYAVPAKKRQISLDPGSITNNFQTMNVSAANRRILRYPISLTKAGMGTFCVGTDKVG
jgi:hypothetical protein